MVYAVIIIFSILGGFVQGITGFGSLMIIMLAMPFFFPVAEAAGMCGVIGLSMVVSLAIHYRRDIKVKRVLLPLLIFIPVTFTAIRFSTTADPFIVKKCFGAFLIVLSIYYLFFSKKRRSDKPGLLSGIFCIAGSAICDGLFGIGGPLMVVYYLDRSDSTREYMGNIQLTFLVTGICSSLYRTGQGILRPEHIPYIIIGSVSILIGVQIANRIIGKMNADTLCTLTYILIGVSGVINLIK